MGPPDSTPGTVVAAVIVDHLSQPARYLAACRSYPPAEQGQWELPGGKVEPRESQRTALEREMREELGLHIAVKGPLASTRADGCWPISPRWRLAVWWATINGGLPHCGHSHDDLRWITPAQGLELPWLPADVAVAHHIYDVWDCR